MRWVIVILGFLLLAHAHPCVAQSPIDPHRAAALKIRKLVGTHLTLYTDLSPSEAVDGLPAVFDAAVPLWANYFGVPESKVADWHVQGYLMRDRQRFAALKLLPKEKPDFTNGYARAGQLWFVEQPSDYYRRHLLLHEGTHAFMYAHLSAHGPGWYMEGLAELLGTHHWDGQRLALGHMPASREETPMWGRIKLIREAVRDGKQLSLSAVMAINERRRWSTEAYAWTWALAKFLDSHPHFQEPFRQLAAGKIDQRFHQRFRKQFGKEWSDLRIEWQAFVATLQYGYDSTKMAMQHKPAVGVEGVTAKTTIAADRGWQSTGWLLKAGQKYQISAKGRYQIAMREQPWLCEPGGVTIQYHAGRPLGILLAALRPTAEAQAADHADPSFQHPVAVGLQSTLAPHDDAVLYLRVNDSPSQLSDNRGELRVTIESGSPNTGETAAGGD